MAEQAPETTSTDGGAPAPPPGAQPWRGNPWFHAGLFALLAFVPRLVYLAQIRAWPTFYTPAIDGQTQLRWARLMLETPLWVGNDAVLAKAPLYSYFLTLNLWMSGGSDAGIMQAHAVQLLGGAITCGLIYLIGRKALGPAAGAVGALLYVGFAPQVFNEGELLDTGLTTLLSACFLLALLHTLEHPTRGRWLGVGLLLGLMGITRPNLLVLTVVALGLLLAWLRAGREREELRGFVWALLAGTALVLLAVTVRNLAINRTGELIPIATNGGINFYTGNNPQADGFSPIPAGVSWERTWYMWRHLGLLTVKQQDAFFRGEALKFWRHHPGAALALLVKKCYLYWSAYDIPNNMSFDWGWRHASLLRALPVGFGIVGTLGLVGLLLGARRTREAKVLALSIAAIMLSVVVVFVNGRYRAPMLPALLPFAGFAVVSLAQAAKTRQVRMLAWGAAGLIVFGLLVNTDLYGVRRTHARAANRDEVYLGQIYQQRQDLAAASQAFTQAVKDNPEDPDAWAFRGLMLTKLGDAKGAAESYRKAVQLAPDFARAAGWLATLSIQQGWPLEEPRRLLVKALSVQTTNVDGLAALVQVDLRRRDLQRAQQEFDKLADAFVHTRSSSTMYEQMAAKVEMVTAEAKQAGLRVPEQLQPRSSQQPGAGIEGF